MNEEGKLEGLPLNRALRDDDGKIYDVVAGPFLVVGLTEENFGSLTPEQMTAFEEKFHSPEAFVRMGRGIMAIPIDERADDRSKDALKPELKPHKKVKTDVPNTELKAMVESYTTMASQEKTTEHRESAGDKLDALAKETAAKVSPEKPKAKTKTKKGPEL